MTKRAENFAITGWVIALVATLGSLYFSEVQQYPPCELCWVQRIFMYPLVLILLVGTLLKDTKVFIYSIVFSSIGLIISIYHYGIQKLEFLRSTAPSCGQVSCTGTYIDWLGFISIPFLAGTAFLLLLVISILGFKQSKGV